MAPPVRSGQARLTDTILAPSSERPLDTVFAPSSGRPLDTIFALSSGRPPAAIGVIRISGPRAFACVEALAGSLPPPRRASLRTLSDGEVLDRALVIVFPGPDTATGEDLAELHCHGGRAVLAAIEGALARIADVRRAEAGEFTRRALINGRVDLLEAEGLADLLEAETEAQRVAALAAAGGQLSRRTRVWLERIALLSARAEALLDHADEDDVTDDEAVLGALRSDVATLSADIGSALASPSVERLRDGIRVVIGGPPNAGKSTLLNLLAERDAAIVSPVAGTTRDRVEAPVLRWGLPMVLIDTAGLTATDDVVEAIGVERAQEAIETADLLLWLGDDPPPRSDAIWLHGRSDQPGRESAHNGVDLVVSSQRPESVAACWALVAKRAASLMTGPGEAPAMREHQRSACHAARAALEDSADPVLLADGLAHARRSLAQLLGLDATELMLDALFSRFCIGK